MHQVMSTPKLSFTFFTRERLLTLVDQDMGLQLVRVRKSRITDFTLVGFLAGVNPKVTSKIGNLEMKIMGGLM